VALLYAAQKAAWEWDGDQKATIQGGFLGARISEPQIETPGMAYSLTRTQNILSSNLNPTVSENLPSFYFSTRDISRYITIFAKLI
jgi:hypothetical protein